MNAKIFFTSQNIDNDCILSFYVSEVNYTGNINVYVNNAYIETIGLSEPQDITIEILKKYLSDLQTTIELRFNEEVSNLKVIKISKIIICEKK